ncbi:uncharacterized protein LOC105179472 [Sesamum indicum]|uniref:Uncharacterized protein LOC105179472 n=1 Tax=Sesamum indicum TaxID=4182 RepID=A0A6I9UPG7_SESIN|nr:uncharacterized protein LOC105179472 [Sesamum indicum]XP_011101402.1 uncharacterized protein LOC105179472 [Sesamum indicum]XP_011101403.1 uncharacterized protein LOC105179472 [Sesamum indicum]XP_020546993.1 uncharacterized protein LOC105179472 [Sesamum indicum]XP_020546994.1 uncharacterized protein LOC105179472 [Sesamum indicum]
MGEHSSTDKLSPGLSGKLKISDGDGMNDTNDLQKVLVGRYYIEEEEEEEDEFSEEALLVQMGYAKSESIRDTLKGPERQYYDEAEEEEEEDLSEESLLAEMGYLKNEPPKHEPITAPMADLHLVSALKGSREKEGKPAKCRVSWAPDVYDPPSTSEEHIAMSKTERNKSEQKVKGAAGKNRQRAGGKGVAAGEVGGKGSRGGGSKGNVRGGKAAGKGKDKKQAKKHGGRASKYSDSDE